MYQRAHAPPEGSRKELFSAISKLWGIPNILTSLTGIHTPISASVSMGPNYMCLCMLAFSLKNTMQQIQGSS